MSASCGRAETQSSAAAAAANVLLTTAACETIITERDTYQSIHRKMCKIWLRPRYSMCVCVRERISFIHFVKRRNEVTGLGHNAI